MMDARKPSLWRHRDFMKLWTAETISQLGSQVTLLGLPLIAVLVLHASPFQVGLLGTAEFLPFLVVGLPAGVWVDRMRRRPILIAADLGRALALATIPVAYELDALTIVHLYAVAFATGVLTVFFDVSYQSYLPSLVDRDQIVEGNSKLEISRSGAQLAGPGLAGVLIDLVKAPVAIIADAISFLGSAACIFAIRKQEPAPVIHAEGERPGMRREIAEGLRYVLRHPLLRPIAATTGSSNLFSSILLAIYVVYAVRILYLRPAVIGLIFALGNTGFLLGASLASRIAERIGVGRAIVLGITLGIPGFVLIPLAPRSLAFPFLVTALVFTGFGSSVYNINQVSLRQVITPERMLGRMNATMRFLVWGTLPIGSLIGGALGSAIGLRPTLWIAAAGAFVPPVFVARSPVRPLREIRDPARDGAIGPDGYGEGRNYDPREQEENRMGDPTPGPLPTPEPQPPAPQPPIPQPEPPPTPPPIPQPEPPQPPVPQPPPV
ncbi:MAG: MFS transporter, partial [Actinomycetota bacterium]|nr:MFS transporter [Actinomycetota bacterium]